MMLLCLFFTLNRQPHTVPYIYLSAPRANAHMTVVYMNVDAQLRIPIQQSIYRVVS